MRKVLLSLFLFLGITSSAEAAGIGLDTFSYESFNVNAITVGVGSSTVLNASGLSSYPQFEAYYTLEGGDVRFRTDGVAPTTTEGHLFASGTDLIIEGLNDVKNFQCLRTATGTSTVRISYMRR